ncbi:hypothetical protein BJ165DRAFT_1449720, partial [Panaeolus papilionaceus]
MLMEGASMHHSLQRVKELPCVCSMAVKYLVTTDDHDQIYARQVPLEKNQAINQLSSMYLRGVNLRFRGYFPWI